MGRFILPAAVAGALMALCGCAAVQTNGDHAAASSATPAARTQPNAEQAARLLGDSARTLRELRKATPNHILDAAIAESRAVIVFPGVYRAGFLYSVRGGVGTLVARRPDGGWGAPVFVTMAGAGYGLQAGLEKSRLVLTITEEDLVKRLLAGSLDLDTTAAYDILGVREQTGPSTLTAHEPVMAFADGVGLMAGAALHGGGVFLNRGMTRSYYGPGSGRAEDVLRGADAPGLEVFELWGALGVAPAGPVLQMVNRP